MQNYTKKGGGKMLESKKRANKKYNAKYKDRVKTIRFDCYPPDSDITEYLEAKKTAGESVAAYLKQLIREDMKRGDTHQKTNSD